MVENEEKVIHWERRGQWPFSHVPLPLSGAGRKKERLLKALNLMQSQAKGGESRLFVTVEDGIVPDYSKSREGHLHSLGKRWV